MAAHRSFAEYVKKRFDNNFWAAADLPFPLLMIIEAIRSESGR